MSSKNQITDEIIDYVGILAKLELTQEEKEKAKVDMASMLDYFDKLNELNTDEVVPMSHIYPINNVFREDVVTNDESLKNRDEILKNAPAKKEGAIMVPKTVE